MLLLVDDNDEFRKAAAEALEAAGLTVAQAADAEEASAIFQEEEITLLVTDLRLPTSRPSRISAGEELAKECLARKPALPVIVVSSHADADLPTRLGSAKVEILAKPFPLEKLARRSIALLAGEPAESTGALPAAVMKKRQEASEERRRPAFSGQPAGMARLWPYLAAASALALLLGGAFWVLAPSAEPAPSGKVAAAAAVAPGGRIEPVAPVGPIGEPPRELVWQAFAGSSRYRVALRGVDDIVLWRGETPASHIGLPAEVGEVLRPALAYYWSVEALDASGESVAAAPKVRFRFVPRGRGAPAAGP